MFEPHGLLHTPIGRASIWRYMDFAKYVSMLESGTLWFTNAGHFEDKGEGMFREATLKMYWEESRARMEKDGVLDAGERAHEVMRRVTKRNRWNRDFMYINCWHRNDVESAAMWKQYLLNVKEGIAIRSTVTRLKRSLAKSRKGTFVAKVRYSDRPMFVHNSLLPYAVKPMCFRFEQEVRAMYYDKFSEEDRVGHVEGFAMPVDLGQLVHSIYVSPKAEKWFCSVVESVSRHFGLQRQQIVPSRLFEEPILTKELST